MSSPIAIDMSTIGDRIVELRQVLKLNQQKFARYLSISRGFVSNVEGNRTQLTSKTYALMASAFNVDLNWLLTGEGDMFKGKPPRQTVNIRDIPKESFKEWLDEFWESATDKEKAWLEVELARHFPEYAGWRKKKETMEAGDELSRMSVAEGQAPYNVRKEGDE
jgi:transcriptional regulator with XRE-family HTH domain